jgi:hypothetical protein
LLDFAIDGEFTPEQPQQERDQSAVLVDEASELPLARPHFGRRALF